MEKKELQLENGNYVRIVNKVIDDLVNTPLLGAQIRVIFFVIRKTWGFNKTNDIISLTQFEKGTGLSRPTIVKTLKNLKSMNILVNATLLGWKFNKYKDSWVVNAPLLVKSPNKFGKAALTNTGKAALTHNKQQTTKYIEAAEAALPIKEDDDLNRVIDYYHELVKWRFKVEASWGRKNYGTLSALLEKRDVGDISRQLKWWFSQEQKELERMGFDFSTIFSVYSTNKYKLYVATK